MLKKFKLAGCDWTVKSSEITDCGATDPDRNIIMINNALPPQSQEVTFYHELVHAILFTMGERNHDERFVEGFGQLLYQYAKQL